MATANKIIDVIHTMFVRLRSFRTNAKAHLDVAARRLNKARNSDGRSTVFEHLEERRMLTYWGTLANFDSDIVAASGEFTDASKWQTPLLTGNGWESASLPGESSTINVGAPGGDSKISLSGKHTVYSILAPISRDIVGTATFDLNAAKNGALDVQSEVVTSTKLTFESSGGQSSVASNYVTVNGLQNSGALAELQLTHINWTTSPGVADKPSLKVQRQFGCCHSFREFRLQWQ